MLLSDEASCSFTWLTLVILHHSSYHLFGWLLLLTLKIRASWNLPAPPDSVGCPSSVLSYHCQLQVFFFFLSFCFFPIEVSDFQGWECPMGNWRWSQKILSRKDGSKHLSSSTTVVFTCAGPWVWIQSPSTSQNGKRALGRTLENTTKFPLYVTKAMKQ